MRRDDRPDLGAALSDIANQHAEKLFAAPEDASEGWRRAVGLNNMLFSAALSTSAMAHVEPARRELLLVDPLEASMTTESAFRRSWRHARSRMNRAMRSLVEPVGLFPSSLAHRRTPGFGDMLGIPTSGVPPMASRMSP